LPVLLIAKLAIKTRYFCIFAYFCQKLLINRLSLMFTKLRIIIVINRFVIIGNFCNRFDKVLTEIFQFRRALVQTFSPYHHLISWASMTEMGCLDEQRSCSSTFRKSHFLWSLFSSLQPFCVIERKLWARSCLWNRLYD